ncbi:MAG: DUF167 domain-containing protein [Anaerolineales bacterium]|nr:DUF167 domain-containing protein [Anaerolineales bacterium]
MSRRKFKLHDGKHGAALTIRVTPRARRTEIGEVMKDGTLRIRVQQPPVDGKANRALIEFLAEMLGVRKNRVEIVAGARGLDKIVSVLDMTAAEVQSRIEAQLEEQG